MLMIRPKEKILLGVDQKKVLEKSGENKKRKKINN